jgi:hypothetical protein
MTTTNTLRKSGALFSERYGVPTDVNYYQWMERSTGVRVVRDRKLLSWAPRGEPSNCPILASNMHRFAKSAPWQLHSVARNVFERIRRDRILAEALATGADPLHLALVFNIDHTTAMAYANAARNLLSSPAEQALSLHPE